jgi:hypothetical protein
MNRNSTGYSQEASVTMTSSKLPTGIMTHLYANSIMVWLGLNWLIWDFFIVSCNDPKPNSFLESLTTTDLLSY